MPSPDQAVHDLLCDLFANDPSGLYQHMSLQFGADHAKSLPSPNVGVSALAFAVSTFAQQHGLHQQLFEGLRLERRHQHAAIDRVAAMFARPVLEPAPQPRSSERLDASSTDEQGRSCPHVHALEEWRMLLDRSTARRSLRTIFNEGRPRNIIVYGDRDQGLDLFRRWLSDSTGSIAPYSVAYSIDGALATTAPAWERRISRALRDPDARLADALQARAGDGAGALLFDLFGVDARHARELATVLSNSVRPALATIPRPIHVLVFHTDNAVPWYRRIFLGDTRDRELREVVGKIQRDLDAEKIHIEPPSFIEIEDSLRKLAPNIDEATIDACRHEYGRLHRRWHRHPSFRRLAEALHAVISRHDRVAKP